MICKILSLEAFIIQIIPAEFTGHKMLLHCDIYYFKFSYYLYLSLSNMNERSINIYAQVYTITHKNKLQINSALDS